MPNWAEVLREIGAESAKHPTTPGMGFDLVRRKYLRNVFEHTKRNVIAYYSGWLQKPDMKDVIVNDKDISGFMLNIHKLERDKGLDIILHTPGGNLAATEALVNYLRKMFGDNIRAIVPQLSMSAGTMIAFACKEIIMGKHSNLGPIDPQLEGIPCQAVIEEFDRAKAEIISNPDLAYLWEFIISKYHPTFLKTCQHVILWSKQLASKWLKENMWKGDARKTNKIIRLFSSHNKSYTHERHIPIDTCKEAGLKIVDLEEDKKLQDLILTVHHTYMHTFANSNALKIIENHTGIAYIESMPVQMTAQMPLPQRLIRR